MASYRQKGVVFTYPTLVCPPPNLSQLPFEFSEVFRIPSRGMITLLICEHVCDHNPQPLLGTCELAVCLRIEYESNRVL